MLMSDHIQQLDQLRQGFDRPAALAPVLRLPLPHKRTRDSAPSIVRLPGGRALEPRCDRVARLRKSDAEREPWLLRPLEIRPPLAVSSTTSLSVNNSASNSAAAA